MKVAQPPLAPVPERKPETPPPPADGAGAERSFRDTLVQTSQGRSGNGPVGRLANGQKAPPPPAGKPAAPVLLEDGTQVPLPAAKPVTPIRLADGTTVPVPAAKPAAPVLLADAATEAGTAAPRAPLPGLKPAVPAPVPSSAKVAEAVEAMTSDNPTAARVLVASQQVAGLSGHSFTAILAQATQESGLDSAAKNSRSSAAGPFQFLESTWLDLFRRHGAAYGQGDLASQIQVRNGVSSVKDPAVRRQILELRHDVDLSAGMAARYLAEGRDALEKRLGRRASESESRMAYVLGSGGAAKLIRAAESTPGAVAADLLPSAAKANHNLFHDRSSGRALSAAETVSRLTRRMEIDQREMFAAIGQAVERPRRLDEGSASPLNPHQSV
ncbi:lytic transglycosylase domain-containing protein (plasmid) [Azospirillum humicireducens]|uniref:Lytic transglycosylase domain-containing protein n=1 Tax=Azospirillum humicireducens TaxID=1226968 RepID=A0A2R4VV51_9PROT|nr:lytic transglycosylase domain-containing protein [Azospirillum humicireducens]AWB08304.1 lytic transglycosylase domain-containing protein [Azospirillum humicireducens]